MYPGDKMANGSHFRGPMSNVMAKKSTETKFKYINGTEWDLMSNCMSNKSTNTNYKCKEWCLMVFSS